jgi:hypothetical protein
MPSSAWQSFDDKEGNYPSDLFEEMWSYLSKVELVLSEAVRTKLGKLRV